MNFIGSLLNKSNVRAFYNQNLLKVLSRNFGLRDMVNSDIHLQVYVGNLSYNVTEDNLLDLLRNFGKPTIMKDLYKPDRTSYRYTYVKFENLAQVEAALKLNGLRFMGSEIRIDKSANMEGKKQSEEKIQVKKSNRDYKKTIHVGRLSLSITEQLLREQFEKFGKITDIRLVRRDYVMAFIQFETEEAAKESLSMNSFLLNGFSMTVNKAVPRD